ncbi:MAG: ribosomal-processing cysteine protease Prp [Candidatus Eremiobacteraeota bacterium]|nr:ribosomal-processing cysteine protease Prp [Candidatus Eremiobacteraeota bacterium]
MLLATIYLTDSSQIGAFEIKGHANADELGKDIVCAGISAIIGTALLGFEDIIGAKSGIEQEDGYTYFCLPMGLSPEDEIKAQVLLETMVLGIKKISDKYPGRIIIEHEKIPMITECVDAIDSRNMSFQGGDLMPDKIRVEEMEMKPAPAKKVSNPYTFEKVFGVAFVGAMAAVLVYYAYNHLSDDTKKVVKETIVNQVRSQVAKFGVME